MGTVLEVATLAHVREIAPRMRAEEVAEVWAAMGLTPAPALLRLMHASTLGSTPFGSRAVFFDGELATIFGVIEMADGSIVPWLLSSDAVERHPLSFWRASKSILHDLRTIYPRMIEYVDARYTRCISWARRLGFTVAPAEPHGLAGLPFHPLAIEGLVS